MEVTVKNSNICQNGNVHKNRSFCQKIEIFAMNFKIGQKSKYLSKMEAKHKSSRMSKNRTFRQKKLKNNSSKFSKSYILGSEMENIGKRTHVYSSDTICSDSWISIYSHLPPSVRLSPHISNRPIRGRRKKLYSLTNIRFHKKCMKYSPYFEFSYEER